MLEFNTPVSTGAEDGDLMTVKEYLNAVSIGAFIDYDGYGYPSNGTHMNIKHHIYPSEGRKGIPAGVTHVVWINR